MTSIVESGSKSLWKWAMSFSIHEETAELEKRTCFVTVRAFGMDGGRCKVANKLEDTQPSWTSQTQSESLDNKESVVPLCKHAPWKLGRVVSLERHILKSVEEFHERIEKLVLGPDDRLITADVKASFMVGEHQYFREEGCIHLECEGPKSRRRNHLVFCSRAKFV